MISFERVDKSEFIDFNKTKRSKECVICHYWYFFFFLMDSNINNMFVIDVMNLIWVYKTSVISSY